MPDGDSPRALTRGDDQSDQTQGDSQRRDDQDHGDDHSTGHAPVGYSLSVSERMRIERAVRNAERSSGLTFSVFVGATEQDSRAYAERLHAALQDPAHSVLVVCDPLFRALEIVTGTEARRNLGDVECGLAAASMETSFAGGDIVGGLVVGIQQLGEASRAPRTLHANN